MVQCLLCWYVAEGVLVRTTFLHGLDIPKTSESHEELTEIGKLAWKVFFGLLPVGVVIKTGRYVRCLSPFILFRIFWSYSICCRSIRCYS
ncbi:hypothetical protein LOAG_14785 [Loa loa]|uniref:Uncharacterized protein n=1 Tax=Loa loa TaxID=7209 RepID=A0A1S0TIF1_LOALO|nr:hypothetical protein LOAG_14785 [Loa loa]EFO13744.2 hypothetical protein LOAG_14785 [Loa loa]